MFVRQKRGRSPARTSRSKSRPAKKGRAGKRADFGALEQRHLDVVGLSLIAAAIYLVLVLYAGWDGGRVGGGASTGLTYLLGKVAYVAPVGLIACGLVLVFKPFVPSLQPLRTGAICLFAGLLLAFAAQTGGIGPDAPLRHSNFDPAWFPHHGGLLGEGLYWCCATLFQRAGAHIVAILLLAVGALLLTGTSIAAVLARAGGALRKAGSSSGEIARTVAVAGRGRPRRDEDGYPTRAAETDVMEDYPDEEQDTVSIVELEDEIDAVAEDVESDDETELVEEPTGELSFDEQLAEAEEDGAEGAAEVEVVPDRDVALTPMGEKRGVTESDEIEYDAPPVKVLERSKGDTGPDTRDHEAISRKLVETLGHFGVEARIVGIVSGPHVSRYELRLAPGIKVKKVTELSSDLAYSLASTDIRILAPIPGKQAVGVEVPNQRRRLVRLGDIYEERPPKTSPLVGWLGKDIAGNAVWTDLAKMPHVLVAGTTGSGKSGCINAILSSILMQATPNECRLVLVDPKRVELNHYENVPHLLTPVVTSPRLAANVLANLIGEMESRYGIMGEARCRNLAELNRVRRKAGEPTLPHILCVIDELADLMMVAPAEVEDSIIRLAQKSRATGIHLVLATQRPSTDIITGTIKVNIPARIAFAVSSQTDSRVILDQNGAEALLGQGDMLFRGAGTSKLQRIQGAFIKEEEIARITKHWARQGEPEFEQELLEAQVEPEAGGEEGDFDPDQDDLLDEAIRLVVQTETASVSMVQRRLRVGYTRAGRLIDMLERRGVISGYEGSKPRQVLISQADLPRVLGNGAEHAPPPADAETAEPIPAD